MIDPNKLSEQDFNLPTWRRLETLLNAKLEAARARNDSLSLSDVQTAELRGRIAQLKEILALSQTKPIVQTVEVDQF